MKELRKPDQMKELRKPGQMKELRKHGQMKEPRKPCQMAELRSCQIQIFTVDHFFFVSHCFPQLASYVTSQKTSSLMSSHI